jgi:UDP-N-acetylglucosamine--N-acetylmuramyl-(pentapeptide) pyrophosphoryl-undecaprenol N-acetylglucosamine transferase
LSDRPILLAAGGTGGHLFPAASLGQELKRRGYAVELATDMRAEKYGGDFPARAIHRIPSATLTSRSPIAVAATFTRLGIGYAGGSVALAAGSDAEVLVHDGEADARADRAAEPQVGAELGRELGRADREPPEEVE